MKRNYNYLIILILAVLAISVPASAQESKRNFSKSWSANEIETLEVINKFGDIKVVNNGGNQVVLEVTVTVEGSESQAREVFNAISVDFRKTGNKAIAETNLASGFKSRRKFSIDYSVSIPESKNLILNNKFGNVVVSRLTGKGEFHISYGNLTGGELLSPGPDGLQLTLEYGKADVESMRDARIVIAYGKLYLKRMESLALESKYSTLSIDQLRNLKLKSAYDTFTLGELHSMDGESKFSNYRIQTLQKRLNLTSGYGTIKVDHIPPGFEQIGIISSFAAIALGIDANSSYQMYAKCEFCKIEYPVEKFSGNRSAENNSQTLDGRISGGSASKVSVVSRYGNVKLGK